MISTNRGNVRFANACRGGASGATRRERRPGFFREQKRPGAIRSSWLIFLGSIAALAVLVVMLVKGPPTSTDRKSATNPTEPIFLYCAAGIRPPVVAAAEEYQKLTGVRVQINPGPSNTLLTNAEQSKAGDLFLPADESYVDIARKKGLINETVPLAQMTVVLAVKKGNPKKISSLDGLIKGDARIAQANADAAAVGKVTRDALTKTGQWDALAKRTLVFKGTVNDVANDIKIGSVDAGFIWDAMLTQYPDLEPVDAPELKHASSSVTVNVLKSSKHPTAALRFARFLGARDKGLKHFEKYGYRVVDGDLWSMTPDVRLFAGSMLRPAIEQTIAKFEEREGCRVTRIYNGCGILVGQMRTGIDAVPDAYFACDTTFMTQVTDLFLDSTVVSTNQLVIVVPKGNARGIKSLKDLGQPGLRLGVGHEKQCAMGALTGTTLDQAGLRATVRKNVVTESATGDMLINQLRTGSLDAVIAYISNAASAGDALEAIAIDIPCATATQPMAIGRESKNKQITARLMAAIESEESKQLFTANGFGWKVGAK